MESNPVAMQTPPSPGYPRLLKPGDSVGIAAPSGGFDPDRFHQGLARLKGLGVKPVVPPGIYEKKGYLAGSDRHRAAILSELLSRSDIAGVVCARGGFGALRLLDRLDSPRLKARPKPFVGFSDITAIHTVLQQDCGWVAFHGPVVTALAEADETSLAGMKQALFGPYPLTVPAPGGQVVRPGRVKARVTGGNLAVLCHLLATPFAPCFDRRILVIEDIAEPPYKIDRILSQMKLARLFENLAGLALGGFEQCGPPEAILKIVHNIFKDQDIPILAGLEIGHGPRNRTFPLGATAVLDTETASLVFDGPKDADGSG